MNALLQDVSKACGLLSIKSYKANAINGHCLPHPMKLEKLAGAVGFFARPAHTCALTESSVACTPKFFAKCNRLR